MFNIRHFGYPTAHYHPFHNTVSFLADRETTRHFKWLREDHKWLAEPSIGSVFYSEPPLVPFHDYLKCVEMVTTWYHFMTIWNVLKWSPIGNQLIPLRPFEMCSNGFYLSLFHAQLKWFSNGPSWITIWRYFWSPCINKAHKITNCTVNYFYCFTLQAYTFPSVPTYQH